MSLPYSIDFKGLDAPELFIKSIHNTGFAIIHNHDISPETINASYQEWKDFFDMPLEYKTNFLFQRDYAEVQDGFFPITISEKAQGYHTKDLKEFYHFSPKGRIPREILSTKLLYTELFKLANILLLWLSDEMKARSINFLDREIGDVLDAEYQTILRAIHYPPLGEDVTEGALRSAPHKDINFMTLMVSSDQPGLEIMDHNKNWHKIHFTDPNSIVINAGEMLCEASNGYYKATTHRVTNPVAQSANRSRYSMPMFVHPKDNVRLSSRYTAREHLDERLRELGLL